MAITTLIGNKARAWAFAGITALTGCGDTYNSNSYPGGEDGSGEDVEGICRDVCARLYQCDPTNENPEETCIRPCIDWNYPANTPAWIDCVYKNECNIELSNTCEKA